MIPNLPNVLLLAYLGDAAFEVLVRERVIASAKNSAEANALALQFVTAKCQSEAAKRAIDFFTEDEREVFTLGKNAKSNYTPRHIDVYSYRLATGLEAVFGYHVWEDDEKRNKELFSMIFP